MNDSPGWATPGSSPSDGERPGAPADQSGPGAAEPPARPAPPAAPAGDQKWSAQQPPPGQWSSPGTGTPPGPGQNPPHAPQGQGWGPYGPQPGDTPGAPYPGPYGRQGAPYGQPGGPAPWGKPHAAKPGIIPLRPLGLGEILDGAVGILRKQWRAVLAVSLVVAALLQVALLFIQRATLDGATAFDPGRRATPSETLDALGDALVGYLYSYYAEILGLFLVTAALAPVVSAAVLGRRSTLSGTLRALRPLAGRMAALTLVLLLGSLAAGVLPMLPGLLSGSAPLTALGFPVGLVLLAWFYVSFLLAPPALMLERGSVTDALKRSAKLVKGAWWRICGISLLTALIAKLTAAVIVMPFAITAMVVAPGGMDSFLNGSATESWSFLIIAAIGSVVAAAVTLPMQTGVTTLLYVDQRIRREALDLELVRAAGIADHGAAPAQPAGGPVTGG
ncbi:hypothetical protein [Streptomyces sp. cmx-4-9]|uniref:hypothetical protein n=1 Tax=Streptomyces sp. cmx-4-9 TaxID=2790941 RepID=UPI0039817B0B